MSAKSYTTKKSFDHHPLWKGKGPLLNRIDIELTERCNNKCIHCYINLPVNDPIARENELTTEEIRSILIEAAALGASTVRFTGGEPLLREDFSELYVFSRKLGMKVILSTNATLIDDNIAGLFAKIPPKENVEISFYGMQKQTYESITRNEGSFEAARKGINNLLSKNIPFIVRQASLPQNRMEKQNFEKWVSTLTVMKRPVNYSAFFDLRGRRDAISKNNLIKKLRISPEDSLRYIFTDLDDIKNLCAHFSRPPKDNLFPCGAGIARASVDAYGYFQSCLLLRHPKTVYHLGSGSMYAALTHFFPKIRKLKATNPDYLFRCAKCFLYGLCDQCPAKSWMEHGTLDTPVEYLCEITHTLARHIGLLAPSEFAWETTDWRLRLKSISSEGESD